MKRSLLSSGEYIQDGIILHLNAMDGLVDNKWVDRVNGLEVSMSNVLKSGKGLFFDGSAYGMVDGRIRDLLTSANATLEIYFYRPGKPADFEVLLSDMVTSVKMGCAFLPRNESVIIRSAQNDYGKGQTYKYDASLFTRNGLLSMTYSASNCFFDGKQLASGSEDNYISHSSGMYIGRRNSFDGSFFRGYIYSIRIYNRILTLDEIKHNCKIDKYLYS